MSTIIDINSLQPYGEAAQKPEYIAVPLHNLHTEAIINSQFYIKIGPGNYVKFRGAVLDFDEKVRRRLKERNHDFLYVKGDDSNSLNVYYEVNLKHTLSDIRATVQQKSEVLYDTTTHTMREVLTDPRSPEQIKRSKRIVVSAVELILSEDNILDHMIQLSSVDYYTYSHSVEVMILSIVLGKRLGFDSDPRLMNIGQAALLHDVGKSYINPDITQKPGPLDESEFNQMKQHPDYGYLALKKTDEISDETLFIIRHHHEDLGGNGYPDGLKSDEIGIEIRIVSCADIFNALTTRRVYRKGYQTYPALKIMKDLTGSKVDEKVFSELVHMLGNLV